MSGLIPDSALRDLRRYSAKSMIHEATLSREDPNASPTLDPDTHQPTGPVPRVTIYDGPAYVSDDAAKIEYRFPEADLVGSAMVRLPVEVGPFDTEGVRVEVNYRGIERTATIREISYKSVATYLLVSWSDVGTETPRPPTDEVPQ